MSTEAIDISPNQDGGIMKRILVPGEGEEFPEIGNTVRVHYVGKLTNGDVFDSSIARKQNFMFTLGKGEVIQGWDITVATMKRNEKCEITLDPKYAYGKHGMPPMIGPNETLIFEIELFDWELQDITSDKSGAILMKMLRTSDEIDHPRVGKVEINLTGYLNKAEEIPFDKRQNVSFRLGECTDHFVPKGIEVALRKMKKNEMARVYIRCPEQGYDSSLTVPQELNLQVPDTFDELVFDVELLNFENEKEIWEMTARERVDQAELTKEKGTEYFKQNNYDLALREYQRVLQFIGPPDTFNFGNLAEERNKQLLSAYLNLALCNLKLNSMFEVITNANLALQIDNRNEKALFRRGQAYAAQNENELAIEDFKKCLEIDANNKAATNQIAKCRQQIREQNEREKKMYKNILNVIGKDKWTKD